MEALALRALSANGQDAINIYGPMEAGFAGGPLGDCLGDETVSGGIDTNLAEHMLLAICPEQADTISVLDSCGGHANPVTGHSTRIGTAGDGNGIYGKNIEGGVEPTDLDACGGRFGVTPDSNGQVVYYYPISAQAPFSVGCYGPVSSVQECRELYPEQCLTPTIEVVTTLDGSGEYALDCPCYDDMQSNVVGQGRPGYLPSTVVVEPPVDACDSCVNDQPFDVQTELAENIDAVYVFGQFMVNGSFGGLIDPNEAVSDPDADVYYLGYSWISWKGCPSTSANSSPYTFLVTGGRCGVEATTPGWYVLETSDDDSGLKRVSKWGIAIPWIESFTYEQYVTLEAIPPTSCVP